MKASATLAEVVERGGDLSKLSQLPKSELEEALKSIGYTKLGPRLAATNAIKQVANSASASQEEPIPVRATPSCSAADVTKPAIEAVGSCSATDLLSAMCEEAMLSKVSVALVLDAARSAGSSQALLCQWATVYKDERPALLRRLQRLGIHSLSERQSLANALSRSLRVSSLPVGNPAQVPLPEIDEIEQDAIARLRASNEVCSMVVEVVIEMRCSTGHCSGCWTWCVPHASSLSIAGGCRRAHGC